MFRFYRRLLVAGAASLLCTASPVHSQQVNPYRELLSALRDTLAPVRAGVTAFVSELRTAESDRLLSLAKDLQHHCQAADAAIPTSIERIQGATRSGRARREANTMVGALRGLDLALRDCVQGFAGSGPGERADTLRIWGVFRSKGVEQALRAYDLAAGRFAAAVDVKLETSDQPR